MTNTKKTTTINVIDNINIKIDITTVFKLKLLFFNCEKSQIPLRYFQIYLTFQNYGSCMIYTT